MANHFASLSHPGFDGHYMRVTEFASFRFLYAVTFMQFNCLAFAEAMVGTKRCANLAPASSSTLVGQMTQQSHMRVECDATHGTHTSRIGIKPLLNTKIMLYSFVGKHTLVVWENSSALIAHVTSMEK